MNTIKIGNDIVLTVTDAVMHAVFGELLNTKVDNLIDRVGKLEDKTFNLSDELETVQNNVSDLESKLDDMPDFDELSGRLDELETVNTDDIESRVDDLETNFSKADHDLDTVNSILSKVAEAIYSHVKA